MGRLLFALSYFVGAAAPAPSRAVASTLALAPAPASAASPAPASESVPAFGPLPLPATPEGMLPCKTPLKITGSLPRAAGETIRYVVDVDGLSVGTVDFKIERRGTFGGQAVVEYRSTFKLDQLVGVLVPMDGRAASIVPEAALAPVAAMNKYRLDKNEFEENQTFAEDGHKVTSKRSKNGETSSEERLFPFAVRDFISSYYLLRLLPPNVEGCAVIYNNQRAYTIWVRPDGEESVKTPVGMRLASRYRVQYASEKSKKVIEARMWLGLDAARLPYRVEVNDKNHLEARIHLYELGL